MSVPTGPKDRRVIPRWRETSTATQTGEAALSTRGVTPAEQARSQAPLSKLAAEFQQTPNLGRAAELTSAARLLSRPELAEDAATYLLMHPQQTTPAALTNARVTLALDQLQAVASPPPLLSVDEVGVPFMATQVRRFRAKLRAFAINPLAHLDLARAYTALGEVTKAERHIRIALGLAPQHRLVLRTAMRFYLHLSAPRTALRLLYRHGAGTSDPWLMAAEISTAMVAEQAPRFVRKGRELLTRAQQSPLQLSELAASLGTLELYAGKDKRARQLFQRSMEQPTENTVAQVRWAKPRLHLDLTGARRVDVPRNFEALAWQQYFAGEAAASRVNFMAWLHDEPFSSRPAHMAAYLADLLDPSPQAAIDLTALALAAEPDRPLLLNNMAFYLASMGRIDEAARFVARAARLPVQPADRVALLATQGLIQFRSGDPVSGEQLYHQAVGLARSSHDRANELVAALYLARERQLQQPEVLDQRVDQVLEQAETSNDPGVTLTAQKVRRQTGRLSSSSGDQGTRSTREPRHE
ncbi:hypothetical protein [Deinococcus ruber]|uniref:Tetratricopeptide repeat protein n=1 Tax=Deinococcus ruber TaxID=1848197 RepID=A0A918FB95_9DEIO|nr:hypothetical protein [Deinococcus ruber]GGR27285.1 hypothetical protein GCM10008957_43330 [Deinococcus ruber]